MRSGNGQNNGQSNGRTSVLVVEDNAVTREALQAYLLGAGYRVGRAGNGHEALFRMRAETPDVLVLDYLMPGMDGLEFLRQLRSEPRWCRLPVVLTTAVPEEESRELVQDSSHLGPVHVLRKPFEPEELLALLEGMAGDPLTGTPSTTKEKT